jgi:hypothetical protein
MKKIEAGTSRLNLSSPEMDKTKAEIDTPIAHYQS